jgi:hypothetical protein
MAETSSVRFSVKPRDVALCTVLRASMNYEDVSVHFSSCTVAHPENGVFVSVDLCCYCCSGARYGG